MRHFAIALLAAAACGHVNPQGSGGGGDDDGTGDGGTTDGTTDPNARGTVHATVIDFTGNGAPVAGAKVVFTDPDGTVVATVDTDANGKAQADVLPGGTVTDVVPLSGIVAMRTVLGIKPGDDIVLGPRFPDTSVTAGVGFNLSWPSLANATSYFVFGPCGLHRNVAASTIATTIFFGKDCAPGATMEILVVGTATGGTIVGYNDKILAYSTGGTGAMNTNWTTSGISFQATVSNSPGSAIEVSRSVTDGDAYSIKATSPFNGNTYVLTNSPLANSAHLQANVTLLGGASQLVRQQIAGNATSAAMDLSKTLLPFLGRPSLDLNAQTITIPVLSSGTTTATADLLETTLQWTRGSDLYLWVIHGPDTGKMTLPKLPAEAGVNLNPTSADNPSSVSFNYKADTVAGYDAVRQQTGHLIGFLYTAKHPAATLIQINHSETPDD